MADRILTPEAAYTHMVAHCPNRVSVPVLGRRDPDYVCGYGRCPVPDPTPEELKRRVDEAAWQMASDCDDDDRDVDWIETEEIRDPLDLLPLALFALGVLAFVVVAVVASG